jgi:phytoene synthase
MNIRSYTSALVRKAQSNFYYAFVFLPRTRRDAIIATYAFSRHTDDLVDDAPSRETAARNLSSWRAETHACFDGKPQHPITANLHKALKHFNIPKEHFLKLIEGVEMDLVKNRYQTFGELYEYCYRVASIVGLICIEIFGYTKRASQDYAVNLGIALQLTNILRDIKSDAMNDRIYLPLEELRRFDYTERDLFAGASTSGFRSLMEYQCRRAWSYYRKAAECLPEEDRRSLFPAEIMGCIYSRLLSRIEAVNYNVYKYPIRVNNLKKLGIALDFCLRSRVGTREKPI